MDVAYLEYVLKKKGISRAQLTQEMGWSETTTTNRFKPTTPWDVDEVDALLKKFDFSMEEIKQIFFD